MENTTIKHDFYDLVTEISKDKELTFSQKRGAIRIVFKKQDRHNLKCYRPITLLNTDVKIITKVLAMRLKKVLTLAKHAYPEEISPKMFTHCRI